MKKILVVAIFFTVFLIQCGVPKNSTMVKMMDATLANCDFGDSQGYTYDYGWKIEKCKNDEVKKLKEYVEKNPIDKVFPTLAIMLGDKNAKMASLVVYLFNDSSMSKKYKEISKNPKLISDKVAKLFVVNLKKYADKSWIQYAIGGIANIAIIKGLDNEIFAIADAEKPDSKIKSRVYSTAMTFGRFRVFDRIKKLGKSKNSTEQRTAIRAVESMRDGITKVEEKTICDWLLKNHLNYKDDSLNAEAASTAAMFCRGDGVDTILNLVEKRIKDSGGKSIESSYRWALNYIGKSHATEKQYERKEKLSKELEKLK